MKIFAIVLMPLLAVLGLFVNCTNSKSIEDQKTFKQMRGFLGAVHQSASATFAEKGFYPKTIKENGLDPVYFEKKFKIGFSSTGDKFITTIENERIRLSINEKKEFTEEKL